MASAYDDLTPQQQRFVDAYLLNPNATEAYKRAGYKGKGRTAENNASRLLGNAGVAAAIEEAQRARSARTQITQDRVLQELAALAFSDITDYSIDDCGNLATARHPDTLRAVSSKKTKVRRVAGNRDVSLEDVETEIKLWDKPSMLKLAGLHVGLFKEREPLEALLALLPPELAGPLREAFGRYLAGRSAGADAAPPVAPPADPPG